MKAILALTIATILWGLNFHLGKVMLNTVPFIEAGFWRYLFGVVLLYFMVGPKTLSWSDFKANATGISLVGIIGLFIFNLLFFLGLLYTTSVNAALIVSLNPALTLVLSNRILKTSLTWRNAFGIAIALVGVVYLMTKGNILNLLNIRFGLGDILIFIANIAFALHHVWVKKYSQNTPIIQFTFYSNLVCLICFLPLLLFSGLPQIGTYTMSFWVSVVGIGCFGTSMAYVLWNRGVKQIGAVKAGIFMNVVPLTAALLSFFFHEPLYVHHLVGGMIIISGLVITLYHPSLLIKQKV